MRHWNDRYCQVDACEVGMVRGHVCSMAKGVRNILVSQRVCNLESPFTLKRRGSSDAGCRGEEASPGVLVVSEENVSSGTER